MKNAPHCTDQGFRNGKDWKIELYSKAREVMIAYVTEGECVTLLTIHPLQEGQEEKSIEFSLKKEGLLTQSH